MSRYFYRVLDDVGFPGRWHLRAPTTEQGKAVDPWQFTAGERLAPEQRLRIAMRQSGVHLDITFAGFDIPVVSRRAQEIITSVAPGDVQFLPVLINGETAHSDDFAILNVMRVIPCLDETRSDFLKWTRADRRPDRTGAYRMVTKLFIDKERISAEVFRVTGWEVALIVSETVRDALIGAGVTGVRFEEV